MVLVVLVSYLGDVVFLLSPFKPLDCLGAHSNQYHPLDLIPSIMCAHFEEDCQRVRSDTCSEACQWSRFTFN